MWQSVPGPYSQFFPHSRWLSRASMLWQVHAVSSVPTHVGYPGLVCCGSLWQVHVVSSVLTVLPRQTVTVPFVTFQV